MEKQKQSKALDAVTDKVADKEIKGDKVTSNAFQRVGAQPAGLIRQGHRGDQAVGG